jgi:precorrin-6B methylase 2
MPSELTKPLTSPVAFPKLRAVAGRIARGTLRLENALFEQRLGISTHGVHNWTPGDWSQTEHLYYYATSYRRIFRILDSLRLGPSDTFIDLGCGKGRVACCASRYPVSQVIGIEDVAELCKLAENNLKLLRGRLAAATIVHGKAEEFEYTSGTVIYMFHPFGPKTMFAVLSRVERGLRLNPREVRIVYVNPVHEQVLAATEWLEMYDRWPAQRRLRTEIMHPVSFWRLRDRRSLQKVASR